MDSHSFHMFYKDNITYKNERVISIVCPNFHQVKICLKNVHVLQTRPTARQPMWTMYPNIQSFKTWSFFRTITKLVLKRLMTVTFRAQVLISYKTHDQS